MLHRQPTPHADAAAGAAIAVPADAVANAKPIRVLHVIVGLGPGGAETALYRLATSRSAVSHEIVSLGPRGFYSSRLEEAGVPVRHLDMTSVATSIRGALRLAAVIRRSGADIVQCWTYRSNVLAGILARLAGIPAVWNIRCSSPGLLGRASRGWARAGEWLAPLVPAAVINCSHRSVEMHSGGGYDRADIEVIPNGYDPQQFFPDEALRDAERKALGTDSGTFLIGSISRWDVYKDIPMLLAALAQLQRRGVTAKCVLVGNGLDEENRELAEAVRESGAGDSILLLGKRSSVPDIARAIDLHVLASRSEGFPNVVAETMLSATPNVSTDVGDAARIVGDTGWVVPPRDVERLTDAIEAAYRQWRDAPDDWQRRRKAARSRIADKFSLDRMVESYEQVWRKVVNGRAAAAAKAS